MKSLYLASPRGFCSGVARAIKMVDDLVKKYPVPIYVYNEIVHNKKVVEYFQKKGVRFIFDIKDLPEESVIVFSAHGVSPLIREQAEKKKCTIIDATCPLVAEVHKKVHSYSRKGYHIIYIGHKNHEEVTGVMAENPKHTTLIENEIDVKKIPSNHSKFAILSQTTLNADWVLEIIEKIKSALPAQTIYNEQPASICYATTARQKAVDDLSGKVDLMLIIGSKNSSNANRLLEIASKKTKAYLLDCLDEFALSKLSKVKKLGISSGASTPESLINSAVNTLKSRFKLRCYGKIKSDVEII
ncbi:MAG: 4-hydroxy-3-methylbut-2-enyl diphosphate reductase [Candidatus Margulisbacteria bacterium]|nr:4-hydroxy-3-methylbut-2-enyl diphosphate reductase [Candidatus Margulisiibacteriota bacterium]